MRELTFVRERTLGGVGAGGAGLIKLPEGVSVDSLQKQVRHFQLTGMFVQSIPELVKEILETTSAGILARKV